VILLAVAARAVDTSLHSIFTGVFFSQFDVRISTATTATTNNNSNSDSNSNSNSNSCILCAGSMRWCYRLNVLVECAGAWMLVQQP
jgi:hypothetical protein